MIKIKKKKSECEQVQKFCSGLWVGDVGTQKSKHVGARSSPPIDSTLIPHQDY